MVVTSEGAGRRSRAECGTGGIERERERKTCLYLKYTMFKILYKIP